MSAASTYKKPYGILRLHRTCHNFALLEQTANFSLYYKCNTCNLHLLPAETMDLEEYIRLSSTEEEHGGTAAASVEQEQAAFLPFQIVTFSKNKEVRTPIVANEFIVHDKTNHREIFYCPVCQSDQSTILVPNSLRDLTFTRICEKCRHTS